MVGSFLLVLRIATVSGTAAYSHIQYQSAPDTTLYLFQATQQQKQQDQHQKLPDNQQLWDLVHSALGVGHTPCDGTACPSPACILAPDGKVKLCFCCSTSDGSAHELALDWVVLPDGRTVSALTQTYNVLDGGSTSTNTSTVTVSFVCGSLADARGYSLPSDLTAAGAEERMPTVVWLGNSKAAARFAMPSWMHHGLGGGGAQVSTASQAFVAVPSLCSDETNTSQAPLPPPPPQTTAPARMAGGLGQPNWLQRYERLYNAYGAHVCVKSIGRLEPSTPWILPSTLGSVMQ
jgi:hypothetical protein